MEELQLPVETQRIILDKIRARKETKALEGQTDSPVIDVQALPGISENAVAS
jgi:hypothetical protein